MWLKKIIGICALTLSPVVLSDLISSDSPLATELETERECVSGGFMGTGLGYAVGPLSFADPSSTAGLDKAVSFTSSPSSVYSYAFAQNVNRKSSLTGFVANFNCGYNFQLGKSCFVFGVIGGGSFTAMRAKTPYAVGALYTSDENGIANLIGYLQGMRISNEGNFDVGTRWGYMFGKRVFAFAHVGWSCHRFVFRSGEIFDRIPRWFSCLVVGGGADVKITKNTLVGLSIDTHIGFRTLFRFTQLSNNATIGFYIKPRITQALVNVKYFFPSCSDQSAY